MIVEVPEVCQKFVTVYLTCLGKKLRYVRVSPSSFELENRLEADQICREWVRYHVSGKSMSDYFNREIVACKRDTNSADEIRFKTNIKTVSKDPIFIGISGGKYHVISHDKIISKFPIQMSELQIAKLFQLHSHFHTLPDLYRYHPVNFKFVEVKGGKCYVSENVPGERQGDFFTITVGKSKDKTYWVPSSFPITKRYYCTKWPGKCQYWSLKANNTLRHMESCEVDSKIVSHQIDYGRDKKLMQSIIDDGLLPAHFIAYRHNYLATYDIESLEKKVAVDQTSKLRIEAYQFPVSIAVSTNLPNRRDKFFIRKVRIYSRKK